MICFQFMCMTHLSTRKYKHTSFYSATHDSATNNGITNHRATKHYNTNS